MMPEKIVIEDIQTAMVDRLFHTITMWNRLEGRPRKDDFDRALAAEVRDPLWMLTKQWQMGEFNGDDAGSPILAKIHLASTRLNKYQPADQSAVPFSQDIPLEGNVEQRAIPLKLNEKDFSLDLRMMMGRRWLKMVKIAVADFSEYYIEAYPVTAPIDYNDPDEAEILAHSGAWQKFAAAAGRKMDGYKLVQHLINGGNAADGLVADPADIILINNLASKFKTWVQDFFLQPSSEEENAWLPERLEYQFACSAPVEETERVYEAEEFYSGRLDWFNLSINEDRTLEVDESLTVDEDVQKEETLSFVPVALDFAGMPDSRWWTFEDNKTYLGDVDPDTTDIGKLLMMEFALVYANDWFLIPQTLDAGTISNVKGLVVTNVFGERTWVEATGKGDDDDWQRWSMYTIDKKGLDSKEADNSMLLLPTVPKVQEGKPIEQITLVRDEMANMVWGIEQDILLASGDRKKGIEAARELKTFFNRINNVDAADTEMLADIRYRVANSVPENWIPFIPVHQEDDNREVQLQRASMPRIIEGSEVLPEKIKPRTVLLRQGLDQAEKSAYYIHEEEVPRAGVVVTQAYQRTRWYGGKVYNWLGVRKRTGRGESSSGLAFDQTKSSKK